MEGKEAKKSVKVAIWVFTVVVYSLVMALHYIPKPDAAPEFTKMLPALNATINGTCFALLILSLLMVKSGKVVLHQRLNTLAMILSVFFLLSYVLYHVTNGDTTYQGNSRTVYYLLLFSHISLAGLSLPAILLAYYAGLRGDIIRHKKLVRYTYPVWLYVTLTGVLVYWMLSPYYV